MVIVAQKPVHAVLFLILAFFNAAGLFILLGAEFLAMLLVVVYVGAVAVLFLFVVMMLDVDFAELARRLLAVSAGRAAGGRHPAGRAVPGARQLGSDRAAHRRGRTAHHRGGRNTEALGLVIYTEYVAFFQAAGLILLVAMVGAIVLTLRHKEGVRRQSSPRRWRADRRPRSRLVVAPGASSVGQTQGGI